MSFKSCLEPGVNEKEKQQKIEVSVIKSEFAVNFKKQLQWILLAYWRVWKFTKWP